MIKMTYKEVNLNTLGILAIIFLILKDSFNPAIYITGLICAIAFVLFIIIIVYSEKVLQKEGI